MFSFMSIKETEVWTMEAKNPMLKAAQVSMLFPAEETETNPAIIPCPKLTKFVLSQNDIYENKFLKFYTFFSFQYSIKGLKAAVLIPQAPADTVVFTTTRETFLIF